MKSFLLIIGMLLMTADGMTQPVSLHPENPHYFMYKGKPALLITSAEHYGAVLNLDIDYKAYLDILAGYGFNQTRIFSGVYCEGNESGFLSGQQVGWDEVQNPLSPRPGKLIAPWARSGEQGYQNGGNKFDLDRWDDAYFQRLKDFCAKAEERGVIVEIVLFTALYKPEFWLNSPLHPENNINGTEDVPYNEFHLLTNKKLIDHQLKMVAKIVREVNAFDNVYFEICNEPYWLKGIPEYETSIKEQSFLPEIAEWEALIAGKIKETEQSLPKQHLVARNIANTYHKVKEINPEVSVLNFHYAFPPDAVKDNYHLGMPVGFDETFGGEHAPDRRKEAWAFILAGGAVYSNLDWSFAIDDLTGLGRNPSGKKISGKEVRDQLRVLKRIMDDFDYIHASPIAAGAFEPLPDHLYMQGLRITDRSYLCYFYKERKIDAGRLMLSLGKGKYTVTFIDPVDGKAIDRRRIRHTQDKLHLNFPAFSDDLVLKIERD